MAEADAERTCSVLVKTGDAYAAATDDYDSLPCGAHLTVRNLLSTSPETVCLDDVLACLQLTYKQFVDMCILSGSDFTTYIPRFGTAAAYSAIKKYGTIEEFLQLDCKGQEIPYKFTDFAKEFDYAEARNRFMSGGHAWFSNFNAACSLLTTPDKMDF